MSRPSRVLQMMGAIGSLLFWGFMLFVVGVFAYAFGVLAPMLIIVGIILMIAIWLTRDKEIGNR